MPGTLAVRYDGANFFVTDTTQSGTTVYGPYATRALAEAQLASLVPVAPAIPDEDITGSLTAGFIEFTEVPGDVAHAAADDIRVYAKDNGSGVTHLYQRRASGLPKRMLNEDDAFTAPTGDTFALAAKGRFAQGYAAAGATFSAAGDGAFARGFAGGTGVLTAPWKGSYAGGYSRGTVTATGVAGHAFGYAGSGHTISAAQSAFAHGQASGTGTALLRAQFQGCFAIGFAKNGGSIDARGGPSIGWGYADGTNSKIYASTDGVMAGGYAKTGGVIQGLGQGAVALGVARGAATELTASGTGSFVHGYAKATGGVVQATGLASLAGGYAGGTAASVLASGPGAFVHGYAFNAALSATVLGAWAGGYAKTNAITASGKGSFAIGYSASAAVVASANNAFQFGPGTNSVANSLQVGAVAAGVHLHGGGVPGTPANGDIWNTGTLVTIRSDGVNIILDQGAAVADASGGSVIDTEGRAALNALLARLRATNLVAT